MTHEEAKTYRASVLAKKLGITLQEARALKAGETIGASDPNEATNEDNESEDNEVN